MIKLANSDITKITNEFTKLIKEELVKKGLVDTGKLLKSISTKLVQRGTTYSFEVTGEDYYKYLDDKFKITDGALDSAGFKRVSNLIEDGLIRAIEKEL